MGEESKEGTIRRALLAWKALMGIRTRRESRQDRLLRLLEDQIWPGIPGEVLGRTITKAEEEAILGFGPNTL